MLPDITHCPPSVQAFVNHVTDYAAQHGISLLIGPDAQVHTRDDGQGLACSGFFEDRPAPRLAVAIGKAWEDWLPILAHEYSHATQWAEGAAVWSNLFADWGRGTEEASAALDGWLEGQCEWDHATLNDVVARAREVELDCERRTLRVIDAFSLPIDRAEYAQKANAYVYYYNHMATTREWYPSGRAPYQVEDVWTAAPTDMTDDPVTPPQLAEAFSQAYPIRPPSRLKP